MSSLATNIFNRVSYLRVSRDFPAEIGQLAIEVNKSYIDIAAAVNFRTISIFTTIEPIITGESWFISKNQRQQSFRQVYTFTSTAAIAHGINLSQIDQFSRMYGQFTDGIKW